MRAVLIRVGHDEHAVVAQIVQVERVAHAAAQRGDERLHLVVRQNFVQARLLDVKDFAPQRQNRLEAAVAALLGAAARRIALDDINLGFSWVSLGTVGQFAR